MTLRVVTGLCLGLFLPAAALADSGRTMIVMDGSGSMWGQIDGRPKLEIAREVLGQVLQTLPPAQELGLIAYGHRTRGQCDDIELMVPVAPGTAADIAARVDGMRFQGKTPLTDAVRQAATALQSGEAVATVVLVTDGLETCDADPCALARELEASGLGFTAHVIGFGLTAEEGSQVACLAEETGGMYLQASDAGALADALTRTVAAEPEPAPAAEPEPEAPPPPARAYFPGAARMPDIALAPTGRSIGDPMGDPAPISLAADGTADQCAAACDGDGLCAAFRYEPPGSLFMAEARCFLFPASTEMDFDAMTPGEGWASGIRDGVLMLVRPYAPAVPASALLSAPATAPQGSAIAVGWDGPRGPYDYVRVLDSAGNWLAEAAVGDANPLDLRLPWATGDFTLAYVLEGDVISEQVAITLTPAPVGITAPATAQVGQEVTITWQGPGAPLDTIQLWNDDTGERWGYDYVEGKDSMVWTMPDVPGRYSLAYAFQDSEIIHRTPIAVTLDRAEAPAALQPVPVTFTGAGTDALPLYVSWSATPAAGQDLPPEAWAMPEGVTGPVSAAFLPGIWDVLGDAGDTVFAGQVTVTAAGPNDFVIPVSAALSPAGPDAAPVTVTFTGPYMGTFRQWAAIQLPDGAILRSDGETSAPWAVEMQPGSWLVTATAAGAAGEGLVAVVEITGAGEVTVGQPTFGMDAFTDIAPFHRQCAGGAPCAYGDEFSGLRAVLLPGWLMQDPYQLTTAAGEGGVVSTLFGTNATGGATLAALNPRQWDAMLGPCEDVAAGKLCRAADMPGEALAGYRALAATLRVTVAAPPAPVIEGTPLNLDPATATTLRYRLLGQP